MRANKITNNGEVLLDLTQDTATPETVGEGVTFHTADGSPAVGTAKLGGGAELNIAYGDTPPEDTTKLWVKTDKPSKVLTSSTINGVDASSLGDSAGTLASIKTGAVFRNAATVGSVTYLLCYRHRQSTSYDDGRRDIWEYTGSGSMTKLTAQMPQFVETGVCAAVGTKIYLLGGNGNTQGGYGKSTIYCFDTETETASTLSAVLPIGLNHVAGAAVGTKIYLFGGYSTNNVAVNTIYCFDTETEAISTLSVTLPQPLQGMGCAAVGTKIYLFGGMAAAIGNVGTIYCFDTETDTIETLSTTLLTPRFHIGCCAIGTDIILCGGVTGVTDVVDQLWVFDTLSNSMKKLTFRPTMAGASIVVPFPTDHSIGMQVAGAYNIDMSAHKYGEYDYQRLSNLRKIIIAKPFELEANHLFINATDVNLSSKYSPWFAVNGDTTQIQVSPLWARKGNAQNLSEYVDAFLYKDGAWQTI